VEDSGSRNGTFVSSEQVVAPRLLADGDVVRLGKILLTFNLAKKTRVQDMTNPEFKK
jgi:pSer/pThr/pTyr-binding forkhead associated (FHA) protein